MIKNWSIYCVLSSWLLRHLSCNLDFGNLDVLECLSSTVKMWEKRFCFLAFILLDHSLLGNAELVSLCSCVCRRVFIVLCCLYISFCVFYSISILCVLAWVSATHTHTFSYENLWSMEFVWILGKILLKTFLICRIFRTCMNFIILTTEVSKPL